MKDRLLVLSLYYPPDLSAGSFRSAALVAALRQQAPNLDIDVLTSLPNRYHSFSRQAAALEHDGRVTIRRILMPPHRSDMVTQAWSYARFAANARRAAMLEQYSLVYATSSRLMTAVLGSMIARRSQAPLYLDIRDLFVDTMADLLPRPVQMVASPVLSLLERFAVTRASRVNVVSAGFEPYMHRRYPKMPLSFYTNGIDDEFLSLRPSALRLAAAGKTVVYAGNIGEGQGLHAIVPALSAALAGEARFRVIGDGGRRPQLVEALAAADVHVELVPPMSRDRLIDEYRAADVLFLHLNDHAAFTRVLPSKIFEYAATDKPILAGVAGYAAEFIRREVPNAAVFTPCDAAAGVDAWHSLQFQPTNRSAFIGRFSRTEIMSRMAAEVALWGPIIRSAGISIE